MISQNGNGANPMVGRIVVVTCRQQKNKHSQANQMLSTVLWKHAEHPRKGKKGRESMTHDFSIWEYEPIQKMNVKTYTLED